MQQHFRYSDAGLRLTKSFEGLRLSAYQDCAGIWTIGYGHTGPSAVWLPAAAAGSAASSLLKGMTISEADADALLLADLTEAAACVNQVVSAPILQHHFDAMVDFCFNAGRGNFEKSTLLRKVNLEDFEGAAAQFGLWVHAGGRVVEGLVRRRRAERQMFESGLNPAGGPTESHLLGA